MTALNSRARRQLKRLAHGLDPVVQVGAEGLSPGLCEAVVSALADHELIKVRIGRAFSGDRKRAAEDLAAATDAHLAQVIGRIAVLYRRRERDDPARPRIELPA